MNLSSPTRSAMPRAARGLTLHHKGFDILIRQASRTGERPYGYTIRHQGLDLHRIDGTFGAAASADRAARQFIDDALGAYGFAQDAFDLAAC